MRHCRRVLWSLAATILVLSCSSRSPEPAQPPRIAFTETAYEFGRNEQGASLTHRYTFRNAGGLDLSIDNVRTSCECATALTPARVIHAGGDGAIEVRWNTVEEIGRATRTITVYSSDPAQPVTTLTMSADVDAEVAVDPARLYVGHVRRGQPLTTALRLLGPQVALVPGPVAEHGNVVTVLEGNGGTTQSGRPLRVVIKPDAPLGAFKDSVSIQTNSRRHPTLAIAVTGVVDADELSANGSAERK